MSKLPFLPTQAASRPKSAPPMQAMRLAQHVYCLSNPAMPHVVKIGLTGNPVHQRAAQLNTTGVPLPFRIQFYAIVPDMAAAERALHQHFSDKRVNPRREFFEITPQEALQGFRQLDITQIKYVDYAPDEQSNAEHKHGEHDNQPTLILRPTAQKAKQPKQRQVQPPVDRRPPARKSFWRRCCFWF